MNTYILSLYYVQIRSQMSCNLSFLVEDYSKENLGTLGLSRTKE